MGEIDGKLGSPRPGHTAVRLGSSFMRPAADGERDHYELFRQVKTVANEGDRAVTAEHGAPIGPLARYRLKGKGDRVDPTIVSRFGPPPEIRTAAPDGTPMTLMLIWWPRMDDTAAPDVSDEKG